MGLKAEAAAYRRAAAKCGAQAAVEPDPAKRAALEDLARQYQELAALAADLRPPSVAVDAVRHVWSPPGRRRGTGT
jgi:hypothetical protein